MSNEPQYRKKSTATVEARLWDGNNDGEIYQWSEGAAWASTSHDGTRWLTVRTLEGNVFGQIGDYVVRGVRGEYYPCRGDIFEETYEVVRPALDAPVIRLVTPPGGGEQAPSRDVVIVNEMVGELLEKLDMLYQAGRLHDMLVVGSITDDEGDESYLVSYTESWDSLKRIGAIELAKHDWLTEAKNPEED